MFTSLEFLATRHERRLSPAEGPSEGAPYLRALQRYAARDAGRYHVPAHKGGAGAPAPLRAALGAALALDVPSCIEGIDLGAGEPPLQRAERLAARAWGARRTWFLVNGATEASHALCLALGQRQGRVVVQRNVHASTIHGLVLGGLRPAFVLPGIDDELGIAHCLRPGDLDAALDRTPDAVAAFVVSPTYFGASADVAALAAVCHERDVALIVDEAWGPHLRFHDAMPQDALSAGADAVVSGTHKLIGSLTQSAMLHLGHGPADEHAPRRLDEAAVARAMRLLRTTSPSSLLLGSLDAARASVDGGRGEALLDRALAEMGELKRVLRDRCGLRVLGDELVGHHGIAAFDPLRLAIDVGPTGRDGHAVAAELLRVADVNLELIGDRVLIAHVGIGEPLHAIGERLVAALQSVLAGADRGQARRPSAAPPACFGVPAMAPPAAEPACFGVPAMAPREAYFADHEVLELGAAAGRVCADSIAVYPPGIANVLPGERFTEQLVAYLLRMRQHGLPIRGTWDERAGTVRVVSTHHEEQS